MQCPSREIVVTHLLIIPEIPSPCQGQGDVSLQKPTTSIYATALFGSQCEEGYISITFVESALGSRVPCGRSGIYPAAQVTWHLAILGQSTETSQLRIVSGLDHDVVFGHGAGCRSWRNPPVNQQPHGFQEGWLRIAAVVEHLARLEDSELDKKLADCSFVRSFASSCGIGLQGESSVKACASLLRQRIEAIRPGRGPASSNPPLPTRAATPGPRLLSEETESSVSSGSDEWDPGYEGSATTSSEVGFEKMGFHRVPSFVRGPSQTCTQDTSNTLLQAAQLTRDPSPGNSTRSWRLVENASPSPVAEDDSPEQIYQEETEGYEDPSSDQSQASDFEHPGYKVWEWDQDRQRWRRRGRSGQEETDWFPESFA